VNDPYMIHRNRPDAMSIPLHPGRPPKNFGRPTGRCVTPYAPSVRVVPPYPNPSPLVPPPPSGGGGSGAGSMMADTTFDINSSDSSMRDTLATMVRRMGGTVVDTTPVE